MRSASATDDAFPAPVSPPREARLARADRERELLRVAWIGIGLRLSVIALELAGVWFLGYAALLVDAVASVFDVVASLAIVLAIRLAARPPDDEHPFGHGRYEPLAGLQLGLLVCAAGLWLAVRYLFGAVGAPAAGDIHAWAWCIPAASAVILEISARIVRQMGERRESTALLAEGFHYRIDAATSIVAGAGLLAASQFPQQGHRIDVICAALLAIVMVILGAAAANENFHQLLDRTPDEAHFERVKTAALRVAGVKGVEKVRIQHAGPDAHVDIDIEVDPDMQVAAAHVITQHVRAEIQRDWPSVREVVVHVEPYYPGDH
jgi:cation diffusion facilitator family transporter